MKDTYYYSDWIHVQFWSFLTKIDNPRVEFLAIFMDFLSKFITSFNQLPKLETWVFFMIPFPLLPTYYYHTHNCLLKLIPPAFKLSLLFRSHYVRPCFKPLLSSSWITAKTYLATTVSYLKIHDPCLWN